MTATSSPDANGRSGTIASSSRSTISFALTILVRSRPGSPWMPMPTSISSSAISNSGVPRTGGVQDESAMPIVRTLAMTFSPTATHSSSAPPWSAFAAAALITKKLPATPRRPTVQVESLTATSSLTSSAPDLLPLGLAHLLRHLPRRAVAGVVVDDVEHARRRVHELGRLGDELHGRTGEHVAGAGRVEHARADDHGVGRLVARPRALDDRHPVGLGHVRPVDQVVLRLVLERAAAREL